MIFVAIVLAILAAAFVFYVKNKGITVRWYEWILGALGIALLYFAILNFNGGLFEETTRAAWLYLIVMGIPALVLLAVPALLIIRRK